MTERTLVGLDEWTAAEDEAARWRLLARVAVLAPSGHNTQPWLFRIVDDGALELLADRTRALPVVDPDDRELTMSCGAALATLQIAAARFRRRAMVERLPDPERPDLMARVRIDQPAEADDEATRLYEVIARRHTDRGPYQATPIAEDTLAELERVARAHGAWLVCVTDEARRAALADAVAEGDRIQMSDPRFRRELAAWVHRNRTRSRDGLPGYAVGVTNDLLSNAAKLVIRLFDTGSGQAAKDRELAEGSPALLVLGTDADVEGAWLRAGEALARVWLEACARNLSVSFLNQPIELPELRPDVAEVVAHDGFPQLLLRVGHPAGDRDPRRSPRRAIEDVLTA